MSLPPKIIFKGPYPFVVSQGSDWELSKFGGPGVYLFTVRVGGIYQILYVGEGISVANRMCTHLERYLSGNYWLYSAKDLGSGNRVPIWKPEGDVSKVAQTLPMLYDGLSQTLPLLNIFVAETSADKPELRRIESAIYLALQANSESKGFLENLRPSVVYRGEKQIVRVEADSSLLALPSSLLA
jgi:hypothetical protein